MKVKSESEVAQLCPTLRDPMDCSPPGSSVRGIFQARVLEWGAITFSGEVVYMVSIISPQPVGSITFILQVTKKKKDMERLGTCAEVHKVGNVMN